MDQKKIDRIRKIQRQGGSQAADLERLTSSKVYDRVIEKAKNNVSYKEQLLKNPNEIIEKEVYSEAPDQLSTEAKSGIINEVSDKVQKALSSFLPDMPLNKVEELVFGTIKDIRKSFKITLILSQVLFYSGLGMVIVAFIVALAGGGEIISLLFGSGGMVSVLLSTLVIGSMDRVQNAAGNLVQLQMTYLSYYMHQSMFGNMKGDISCDQIVKYSEEMQKATDLFVSTIEKYTVLKNSKK